MATNDTRRTRTEVRFSADPHTPEGAPKGGRAKHIRLRRTVTTMPVSKSGAYMYGQATKYNDEIGIFPLTDAAAMAAEITSCLAYLAMGEE